jgi:3-methyladenine DNA glycosylase AlkD
MNKIISQLKAVSNPQIAEGSRRFFKTGKGDYGEGDKFLGIRVPILHKIAKEYAHISLTEILALLKSPFHEIRLVSLFILTLKYEKSDQNDKEKIVNVYLGHTAYINNWDLVDTSAHKILGDYLFDKKKDLLYRLARSKLLWERRIAIIATFKFIKNGSYHDTIKLSEILVNDKEDLLQKAVGWMLREVGKKDLNLEMNFLNKYSERMPRTMLRYAVEKFPEHLRQKYLQKS